jgi:hypothetical protein
MNNSTSQAYLNKIGAQMKVWGAKVELVKARVQSAIAGANVDYRQQLDHWQEKESALLFKAESLQAVGSEKFECIKADVKSVWHEIKNLTSSQEDKKNEIQK